MKKVKRKYQVSLKSKPEMKNERKNAGMPATKCNDTYPSFLWI